MIFLFILLYIILLITLQYNKFSHFLLDEANIFFYIYLQALSFDGGKELFINNSSDSPFGVTREPVLPVQAGIHLRRALLMNVSVDTLLSIISVCFGAFSIGYALGNRANKK